METRFRPFAGAAIFKRCGAAFAFLFALVLLYGILSIRYASNSPLFNISVAIKHKLTARHVAIAGKGDWLYFQVDLAAILNPWKNISSTINEISSLNDSLSEEGIKLLLVPVPDKESIIQGYSPFEVNNVSNQRSRVLNMLRKHNVTVIDLAPEFMACNEKEDLYQKKDTHWDGKGILIAAKAISDMINKLLCGRGQARYVYKDTCVSEPKFLAMLAGDSSSYPCACRMVLAEDGSPFRDSINSDIIIYGDSFTGINHAFGGGIGAQIAYFTNRPTYTLAYINFGGKSAILDFLEKHKKRPKILVWMFHSAQFMAKNFS